MNHFCCIKGSGLESDNEKIANSLVAIQQYDVVGVYEDMPRFLADVSRLLGFSEPPKIARVNITRQRPKVDQISQTLRERIVALNQLDLRLYAEVVAWKASVAQTKGTPHLLTVSKGQDHEPIHERVITTPDITILTSGLREGYDILHGQLMTFDVDFFLAREAQDLEMGIHIFDSDRRWAFGINSTLLGQSHQSLASGCTVSVTIWLPICPLEYIPPVLPLPSLPEGRQFELAWQDVMCEFQVSHRVGKKFAGYSYLPAEISLCPTGLARAEMVVSRAQGIKHSGRRTPTYRRYHRQSQ